MNHVTHIPGDGPSDVADYEHTMYTARKSSASAIQNPQDIEGMEQSGSTEEGMASYSAAMGYQLFAGGHEVDSNVEYNPDEMLVPTKEAHELIDEVGYEQGDRTDENGDPIATHGEIGLQLAINERYMNEGYDEIDGPVVVSNIERTGDGWDFNLHEEPNWEPSQGYPESAT
jgi:hypothetical protein